MISVIVRPSIEVAHEDGITPHSEHIYEACVEDVGKISRAHCAHAVYGGQVADEARVE